MHRSVQRTRRCRRADYRVRSLDLDRRSRASDAFPYFLLSVAYAIFLIPDNYVTTIPNCASVIASDSERRKFRQSLQTGSPSNLRLVASRPTRIFAYIIVHCRWSVRKKSSVSRAKYTFYKIARSVNTEMVTKERGSITGFHVVTSKNSTNTPNLALYNWYLFSNCTNAFPWLSVSWTSTTTSAFES